MRLRPVPELIRLGRIPLLIVDEVGYVPSPSRSRILFLPALTVAI